MRLQKRKALTGILVPVALFLTLVAAAPADTQNPKGEYAPFSECPLSAITVTDCIYSISSGGNFTVGAKELPLFSSLRLQGGFAGAGEEIEFFGAENGDTLTEPAQPLASLLKVAAPSWWPGFLRNWFDQGVKEGHTGVIATIELLGPAEGLTDIELSTENLLATQGVALGLPVRISLSSDLLGDHCYVGSTADPIELHFTTGKSGPLRGRVGNATSNGSAAISTLNGTKLVDATYTAPKAIGCGGLFSYFLDPLVDSILGLPSPSGGNTATLEGRFKDAVAAEVSSGE